MDRRNVVNSSSKWLQFFILISQHIHLIVNFIVLKVISQTVHFTNIYKQFSNIWLILVVLCVEEFCSTGTCNEIPCKNLPPPAK